MPSSTAGNLPGPCWSQPGDRDGDRQVPVAGRSAARPARGQKQAQQEADRCAELFSEGARSGCNGNTPREGTGPRSHPGSTQTGWLGTHCRAAGMGLLPPPWAVGAGGTGHPTAPSTSPCSAGCTRLSPGGATGTACSVPCQAPSSRHHGIAWLAAWRWAAAAGGGTSRFRCGPRRVAASQASAEPWPPSPHAPGPSREPFISDALLKLPCAIAHGRRDGGRRIKPDEYFRP